MDFIPSDIGLSDMEVSLVNVMAHEKIMEQGYQTFEGEMLRLHRNQHPISRNKRCYGDDAQRGHTVNQAVVVFILERLQCLFHDFLGYEGTENGATISDLMESVIKDEKPPEVVIHHEEKVDFIPSDIGLSDMEVSLVNVMAHEKNMEQALEPFKDKYDYCLIDCMPSLGIITVASLSAVRVLTGISAR